VKIDATLDTSVLDQTAARYTKNLAISASQALNDTAREAQRRVRDHIIATFHVRSPVFIDRLIKIFAFSNVYQDRPFAELGVDLKGRSILSLFEEGGERFPFVGQQEAIPITGGPARPAIEDPVPDTMTFAALKFRKSGVTGEGQVTLAARKAAGNRKRKLPGGYYLWRGEQRTFILPSSQAEPSGGVFQRVGPGKDDIRLVYAFKPSVQLRPALEFIRTSQQTFDEVFADAFNKHFFRL
jgi:hypothetical protein